MTGSVKSISSKSDAVDNEPYLRSICRIEQERSQLENRKNSRFYHYLRNTIDTNLFATNIFDEFAEIFQKS